MPPSPTATEPDPTGPAPSAPAGAASAALLMLGDGRLPAGGYAHSGGLEQAISRGWVRTAADLLCFLRGRVHTTGLINASFAAAAQHRSRAAASQDGLEGLRAALLELEQELLARTPSPALRSTGRDLGRMLLRSLRSISPQQAPVIDAAGPVQQQPLAYGVVSAALGLDARHAAGVVMYDTVASPAVSAVKLMSIDPFAAHRCLAELAGEMDEVTDRAVAQADRDPPELPVAGAPMSDLFAELHTHHDQRLFAS